MYDDDDDDDDESYGSDLADTGGTYLNPHYHYRLVLRSHTLALSLPLSSPPPNIHCNTDLIPTQAGMPPTSTSGAWTGQIR